MKSKTLPKVLSKILAYDWLDALIVDDNSSDGTAKVVEDWPGNSDRFHIIKRPMKLGLGSAYITGIQVGT